MHSLNDLVDSGKVHYLGISDTPAWVVSKLSLLSPGFPRSSNDIQVRNKNPTQRLQANQYARDHGLRQFVVYQGLWNASMRDFERDIIPICRDEGIGICAYATLGQGCFQSAASFAEREKVNPGRTGKLPTAHDKAISAVLEAIANRKGVSHTNVAMAYCMAKAAYVFPIVGGRKVEHLKANIEGLTLCLSEEDIREIETGYAFDPRFPHTFLIGTVWSDAALLGAYKAKDVCVTKFMGTIDWVEGGKAIQPAEM